MSTNRISTHVHFFSTTSSMHHIYENLCTLNNGKHFLAAFRQCLYDYSDLPDGKNYLTQIWQAANDDIQRRTAQFKQTTVDRTTDEAQLREFQRSLATPLAIINTIVQIRKENADLDELRSTYLQHKQSGLLLFLQLSDLSLSAPERINAHLRHILANGHGEEHLIAAQLIALRSFYTVRAETQHDLHYHESHAAKLASDCDRMKFAISIFNIIVDGLAEHHAYQVGKRM